MPVTDIKELRILPPMAIARFGSASEPMHNYDVRDPVDAAEFRALVPAETLIVDPVTGVVVGAVTPPDVRFRDGANQIKPVCPFLELWARFTDDGAFEPLTTAALQELGVSSDAVRWTVRVGNLKMFRRTGEPRDRITCNVAANELAGHARVELRGRCQNFKTGMTIGLGWAQYVRPTDAFPEIRLRFTPAVGHVFGHTAGPVIPANRAIYNAAVGPWDNHADQVAANSPTPRARLFTAPGGIFAQTRPGVGQARANLGYFDDSCDGIVSVAIEVGGRTVTSLARISSGPPDFAPDSFPVRTVADDLEQWLLGEDVESLTADEVISIVRRAVETVRLMNTETENRTFPFWVETAQQSFGPDGAKYVSTRGFHEALLTSVQGLREAPGSPGRRAAVGVLRLIVQALRPPDKTADYTTTTTSAGRPAMQQMPALMRGADGGLLSLSRRQQRTLAVAIEQFGVDAGGDSSPRAAMLRLVSSHQFAATLHSGVVLPQGQRLSDLFARPEAFLAYLADPASVAHGALSQQLGFGGQTLVSPGDPDGSSFFRMISRPDHPMNGALSAHVDPVISVDGIEVVRRWIASL